MWIHEDLFDLRLYGGFEVGRGIKWKTTKLLVKNSVWGCSWGPHSWSFTKGMWIRCVWCLWIFWLLWLEFCIYICVQTCRCWRVFLRVFYVFEVWDVKGYVWIVVSQDVCYNVGGWGNGAMWIHNFRILIYLEVSCHQEVLVVFLVTKDIVLKFSNFRYKCIKSHTYKCFKHPLVLKTSTICVYAIIKYTMPTCFVGIVWLRMVCCRGCNIFVWGVCWGVCLVVV